ncbi:MAG: WS/DGAT domain-containing protein, partial [Myxococcota bacterium]
MVVTNVPGPQIPMYMSGARLLEIYPHVPLIDNLGLGIALMSYDGKLCWGFNADYDLVPDLPAFVHLVEQSFEDLRSVADEARTREATAEDAPAAPARRTRRGARAPQARTNGSTTSP